MESRMYDLERDEELYYILYPKAYFHIVYQHPIAASLLSRDSQAKRSPQ